ncbi:MAG: hypothetical protein KIH08_16875 [Candidatus Freyarchaeota archaeon]|nr:hypothetical protein [Candidatus Jordarchaeia archaeon]
MIKEGKNLSFFKKKKEEEKEEKAEVKKTEMEEICGDKEVYEALHNTMFLDPRKITMTSQEAAKKAEEFEKSGDLMRARIWYQTAGGLAIYEGNVEKVKEYFGKCKELSQSNYKILKIPEKAVQKAQEYYRKYLK